MEQHSYQNSASGSPSRRNRGSGDRGFWLAACSSSPLWAS